MSRLVTASLFGSVNWAMNAPPSWRERAYKDLENTLNRVWNDPNPAAQRGIDFEKTVYSLLNKGIDIDELKCSENFRKVLNFCYGGEFQKKIKKIIEIDGTEYCLYGKMDVWFPALIMDLKTTANYKGKENYLKSMQHRIYCYVTKIKNFKYVIVEFIDDVSNTIENVFEINYTVTNFKTVYMEIENEIKKVLDFLQGDEALYKAYLTKYSLY